MTGIYVDTSEVESWTIKLGGYCSTRTLWLVDRDGEQRQRRRSILLSSPCSFPLSSFGSRHMDLIEFCFFFVIVPHRKEI